MTEKNRYVLQLIQAKTGMRSKPFVATHDELVVSLRKHEQDPDDYILVVARVGHEDQIEIEEVPIFNIGGFLEALDQAKVDLDVQQQMEIMKNA